MTKDTDQEIGLTKICIKCKVEKLNDEFAKNKGGKYGTKNICKECIAEYSKERRIENPDRERERGRRYKENNKEKVSEAGKIYYQKNKERVRIKRAIRYRDNKEYELERNRIWAAANPDKVREIGKRQDEKIRSTPKGKLESAVKAGVHRGLKKGAKSARKTFDILGYSIDDLMRHLERQFQPGMTWNNHGTGEGKWHIDHIIPLAAHNYETPDDIDFKRAWALSNLQPLWAIDNIRKRDKIEGGFQPSFAMALPADNNNEKDNKDDAA